MIQNLKTCNGTLNVLSRAEPDCWINLAQPTMEETTSISRDLGIPLDFLTDPLDADETPRMDVDGPNMLMVVRTPRFDPDADVQYTTVPLGIILGPDRIVTVSALKEDVLDVYTTGKARNFSTVNRTHFVLHIFRMTALLYLNHLKAINKKTTGIEAELHKSLTNEALLHLLDLEKGLVFFTTSIRSNELMMERLQKTQQLKMSPEDQEFLEDVIVDNRQAIEMADIYSNILSGMMDAFASIISNNLSIVLKFLTSVTIILMLPTLVASIYGMNVPLPFRPGFLNSPHAFLITMVGSIALSVGSVILFRKKHWL